MEEHFGQVILERGGDLFTTTAVERCTPFCLPQNSFTTVDKTAYTSSSCSKQTNSELGYIIYFQTLEAMKPVVFTKFVADQFRSKGAQFIL